MRREIHFKKGEGDVSHTVSLYFRVAYGVYTAAKVDKLSELSFPHFELNVTFAILKMSMIV